LPANSFHGRRRRHRRDIDPISVGHRQRFRTDRAALNNSVENQTSVETLVKTQRSSVSGVNIDEETTNLMMYQKAYEASSRFMSIIDNLLETLISLGTGA